MTFYPNEYSRFWYVPVNNRERFLKKSENFSQSPSLVSLYKIYELYISSTKQEYGESRNKWKLYTKIQEIFLKNHSKKARSNKKKKIFRGLLKNPLQYLCTKFRICNPLLCACPYTDCLTDRQTMLRLRFIIMEEFKKNLPKCAITWQG